MSNKAALSVGLLASLLLLQVYGAQQEDDPTIFGVHLSTQSDPGRDVTVTWFTDANSLSAVSYGSTVLLGTSVQGKTTSFPRVPWYIHEARLTSLQPGTRYYYKVGDPEKGWSKVHSFVTAGGLPFRFIVWGDQQTVGPVAQKTVGRAKEWGVPLLVHAGDLAGNDADWSMARWRDWFKMVEPVLAETIYMPSIGNHEYEPPEFVMDRFPFLGLFSLPRDERSYSFKWGGVYFLSLEIGEPYRQVSATEAQWIESELARANQDTSIKWKIIYFHTPYYSSGDYTSATTNPAYQRHVKPFKDRVEPLLKKYDVDLVLTGHDHIYERSLPVYQGEVWRPSDIGVLEDPPYPIYIVTGGSGDNVLPVGTERPIWSVKKESVSHYLLIDVSESSLTVKALRTMDNSLLDEFRIVKATTLATYWDIKITETLLCKAKELIGRKCSEGIWGYELDPLEWLRLWLDER